MEAPPLAPGLLHCPACGETVRTRCHIERKISPIRPHRFARHHSLISVYPTGYDSTWLIEGMLSRSNSDISDEKDLNTSGGLTCYLRRRMLSSMEQEETLALRLHRLLRVRGRECFLLVAPSQSSTRWRRLSRTPEGWLKRLKSMSLTNKPSRRLPTPWSDQLVASMSVSTLPILLIQAVWESRSSSCHLRASPTRSRPIRGHSS